jgi:uncharacterized membrane protein
MTALTSADPMARLAERQTWITSRSQEVVQNTVREAFEALGPKADLVRDALHGTWLHEPLHAIMTDIPVGSWTAAVLFDAIGAVAKSEKMDTAADALVILGLAGALGASITGINDWAEVKKEAPRRIGAVHALLNIGATAFFGASCYFRRKNGSRGTARSLAVLGYVVVSASAHLGGNLVYEHGIGVERGTAGQD